MKRISILLTIILISFFSVNAYAQVKIDGMDNGIEWQGADYTLLISEPRVNNVDFAHAKTQVSSEYEVDYFLFLSDLNQSYDNSGFVLNVNNSLEIKVSMSGVEVDGDSSEYYVDSAMADIGEGGVSCEIRVGFKRGLPKEIKADVCFIDGNGNYSYYYPLSVVNPHFAEETDATQATTKESKTEKLTEKKTEESKTEKNNNPTETKTTKPKATKNSSDKTVVYFYEKEVIVSQVYDSVKEEPVYEHNSSTELPSSSSANIVSVSEGLKIQRIICIAGGAVLLGVGAWASLSVKRRKPEVRQSDDNSKNSD